MEKLRILWAMRLMPLLAALHWWSTLGWLPKKKPLILGWKSPMKKRKIYFLIISCIFHLFYLFFHDRIGKIPVSMCVHMCMHMCVCVHILNIIMLHTRGRTKRILWELCLGAELEGPEWFWRIRVSCLVTKLYKTLCDPMDYSLPDSSVRGISQTRIVEWGAISFSRESSWPRNRTHVFCVSCIGRITLYHWTTWEALKSVKTV